MVTEISHIVRSSKAPLEGLTTNYHVSLRSYGVVVNSVAAESFGFGLTSSPSPG